MEINFGEVRRLIKDGYISVRKHPTGLLWIYNYTPRCQYEKKWTPETMQCRGLIADAQDRIVSRPFGKFFNLEELDGEMPSSPFAVYDKIDGSLCISYRERGGRFRLATRGSFESEQAGWANEILRIKYIDEGWNAGIDLDTENFTYLFELIDPRNRIVVDYGETSDLILLAIIETASGEERDIDSADLPFPCPKKYGFQTLDEIVRTEQDDEREGFVLKFQTNERVKFKFAEYKRLHKLLTQISSKSIWESLRDGKPLDEILERVPDEFFQWVKKTRTGLEQQYATVEALAKAEFRDLGDRKENALYYKTCNSSPSILFNMLDRKDYAGLIWKGLRPKFEKPFREDADNA